MGTTLDGRFTLLAHLDYDIPGVSRFHANDSRLDADVTVDVITSIIPSAVRRTARLASMLRDPRLGRIVSVGDSEDAPYLVTEVPRGVSLARIVDGRRLPDSQARALVGEVARALEAAATASGLTHGWLRPAAITVSDGVTITGLGVEGELAHQAGIGRGRDERADAGALARILLACVTGRSADESTAVDLPAGLSEGVREVCEAAIAGTPPHTLAEVREAMGAFDTRVLRGLERTWRSLPLSLVGEKRAAKERERRRRADLADRIFGRPRSGMVQLERDTILRAAAAANLASVPASLATSELPVLGPPAPAEAALTTQELEDLHDLYTFDAMVEEQVERSGPSTSVLVYERLHQWWPRSRVITRRLQKAQYRYENGGPLYVGPFLLVLAAIGVVTVAVVAFSLVTNAPSADPMDPDERLSHYPEFTFSP